MRSLYIYKYKKKIKRYPALVTSFLLGPPHLILLQQLDFDGQVVSGPLVPLPLALELFLGALQFGQGGGVPRPQVQLLQVDAVRIILNPGCWRSLHGQLQLMSSTFLSKKLDNHYSNIFAKSYSFLGAQEQYHRSTSDFCFH